MHLMTSVTTMTATRDRRHSGIEVFGALEVRISRTSVGPLDGRSASLGVVALLGDLLQSRRAGEGAGRRFADVESRRATGEAYVEERAERCPLRSPALERLVLRDPREVRIRREQPELMANTEPGRMASIVPTRTPRRRARLRSWATGSVCHGGMHLIPTRLSGVASRDAERGKASTRLVVAVLDAASSRLRTWGSGVRTAGAPDPERRESRPLRQARCGALRGTLADRARYAVDAAAGPRPLWAAFERSRRVGRIRSSRASVLREARP